MAIFKFISGFIWLGRLPIRLFFFCFMGVELPIFSQSPPSLTNFSNTTAYASGGSSSQGGAQVSVDHFSGKPKIAIPIGGVDPLFQMGLNYSSGGFPVASSSSQVGLGWAFSGGGYINRITRGKPDEVATWWHEDLCTNVVRNDNAWLLKRRLEKFSSTEPEYKSGPPFEPWEPDGRFLEQMAAGRYDTEFDFFQVTAPGLSASFYFRILHNEQTNVEENVEIVHLVPSKNKIKLFFSYYTPGNYNANNIKFLDRIEIETEAGDTYFFNHASKAKSYNLSEMWTHIYGTRLQFHNFNNSASKNQDPIANFNIPYNEPNAYPIEWALEEIVFSNGEIMEFEYESGKIVSKNVMQTNLLLNPEQPIYEAPYLNELNNSWFENTPEKAPDFLWQVVTRVNEVDKKFLKEIRFRGNRVLLTYSPTYLETGADRKLDNIRFFQQGAEQSRYSLDYSFFNTTGRSIKASASGNVHLCLETIRVQDFLSFTERKIACSYFYSEGGKGTPGYTSYSFDHWGYFNGATSNLIPNQPSDRNSHESYGKVGLLTGLSIEKAGNYSLDYEPNSAYLPATQMTEQLGGFRVKTVSFLRWKSTEEPKTTDYFYNNEPEIGAGSNPIPATSSKGGMKTIARKWTDFTYNENLTINNLALYKAGTQNNPICDFKFTTLKYKRLSSIPTTVVADENGRTVVYNWVTEVAPDKTKIVQHFDLPEYVNFSDYTLKYQYIDQIPPNNSQGLRSRTSTISNIIQNGWDSMPEYSRNQTLRFRDFFYNGVLPDPDMPIFRKSKANDPAGRLIETYRFRKDNALAIKTELTYEEIPISQVKGITIQGFHPVNIQFDWKDQELRQLMIIDYLATEMFLSYGVNFNTSAYASVPVYLFRHYDETLGYPVVKQKTETIYDLIKPGPGRETVTTTTNTYHATGPLIGQLRHTETSNSNLLFGHSDSKKFVKQSFFYPQDVLSSSGSSCTTVSVNELETFISTNQQTTNPNLRKGVEQAKGLLPFLKGEKSPIPILVTTSTYFKPYNDVAYRMEYITNAQLNLPYEFILPNGRKLYLPKYQYTWSDDKYIVIRGQSELLPSVDRFRDFRMKRCSESGEVIGKLGLRWVDEIDLDFGFRPVSEVLEISSLGQPIKVRNLLNGEITSRVLGFFDGQETATIGQDWAGGSAYTGFETPAIYPNAYEQGWAIYTHNPYSLANGQISTTPGHRLVTTETFDPEKAATGTHSLEVLYGFGPTISLKIDPENLQDINVSCKARNVPGSGKTGEMFLNAYVHNGASLAALPGTNLFLSGPVHHLEDNWKEYTLTTPLNQTSWKTALQNYLASHPGETLFLRVYSQNTKNCDHCEPTKGSFLVDDVRATPTKALLKYQTQDPLSGSTWQTDANGKMIKTLNRPKWTEAWDHFGDLNGITVANP